MAAKLRQARSVSREADTIEWGWIRKLLTRGQRGKVSQLGDAFTRRSMGNLTRARDECPRYTRRDAAYNSRDTRSNTRHEWMIRGKPDFPWKIIILETGEEVASEKRDIVEIGKVEMVFVKCESEF